MATASFFGSGKEERHRPTEADALVGEFLVDTPFVRGTLKTWVFPEDLRQWQQALDFLDAGQDIARREGKRSPWLFIELVEDDDRCQVTIKDHSMSLTTLTVAVPLDDLLFDSGPICRSPDQASLLVGRLVRSLTSPESEPLPSGFAGLDRAVAAQRACSVEVRAKCRPDTVRRWIDSMVEWYVGALSVVAHRQMGKVLGFRDYLNLGHMDRAIRYCVVVIQIAEGTVLPNAELESPLVRAVTEAAYLLVTMDSDLYSYKKEALEGTLEMNVVSALMQEGHSAEYAVRRAFELRNMVMVLFMQLIRQAGAGASAELSRYLGQLEHLVRGNLDWGLRAPRYDVQGDAVPFRLVAAPQPDPLVPSALPEIAWWWELIA